MDIVGPILDIVTKLCDCIKKYAMYIMDLEETMSSLRWEMDGLESISEDVRQKVALEQQRHMVPKRQVLDWLSKVETAEKEVQEILQQGAEEIQQKCLGNGCPKNCRSTYKLGKRGTKALNVVKDLRSKGDFDVVAHNQLDPVSAVNITSAGKQTEGLHEMPMEKDIGLDSTSDEVWKCLVEDQIVIIGLYGMGGAGKTTLLKRINNELLKKNHAFDLVMWVVASKQARVDIIQRNILTRLHVPAESWRDKNEDDKAIQIFQLLMGRKFIFLLDDLWERLDLSKVGIPLQNTQHGCKVVFTTRSEEVCGKMEAHKKIRVRCLTRQMAWALFQEKVGYDTLNSHPDIPGLARVLAQECDGLPLALTTIGRAMASRKTPFEWQHAIQVLRTYPSRFSDMGDQVLPILKFSYDSLPDETIKRCFLYCSLFPEDYEIVNDELVYLWMGEGFLKDFSEPQAARIHGLYIIETLKLVCLLEDGGCQAKVKMHDVLRDMALWIACEYGSKNRFMILEYGKLEEANDASEFKEAERMAFWSKNVSELPHSPHCPSVVTCFIRECGLEKFPVGFFQYMRVIKVLDLSDNEYLGVLPASISNLAALEYLNISKTRLKRLPVEAARLEKLRYLLMDFMACLEEIPMRVISSFSCLQVFRMNYSCIYEGRKAASLKDLIKQLDQLKYINEIGVYLCSNGSVKKFISSNRLQRCSRYLRIENCFFQPSELSMTSHLETLQIYRCSLDARKESQQLIPEATGEKPHQPTLEPKLKQVIPNSRTTSLHSLNQVIIYRCRGITNLNFLVDAPSIQTLWVSFCQTLVELISEVEAEGDVSIFANLRKLRLDNVPYLSSIYPGALPFPSLEEVYVIECPVLSKLPFDHRTMKSPLSLIQGDPDWFHQLQWGDTAVESHFRRYFEVPSSKRCWPETRDLYLTRGLSRIEVDGIPDAEIMHERQDLVWASMNM
ncbi:hypothetical protein Ancab_029449 [Ancistrocladus abbreviatus]